MKKAIYPFKFIPQPKERVWGGHRLAAQFHKPFDAEKVIGESWEISGFEDDSSVIAGGWLDGNPLFDVIETYMDEIVGDDNYKRFGDEFPILVKLLDINDRLQLLWQERGLVRPRCRSRCQDLHGIQQGYGCAGVS